MPPNPYPSPEEREATEEGGYPRNRWRRTCFSGGVAVVIGVIVADYLAVVLSSSPAGQLLCKAAATVPLLGALAFVVGGIGWFVTRLNRLRFSLRTLLLTVFVAAVMAAVLGATLR